MNLPHLTLPEWESPDASALREFLDTPTGKKIFSMLWAARPELKGATVEESALQQKTAFGYELAMNVLSALAALTVTTRETISDNPYPSLEDDSKWPEGDKIQPQ